MKSAPFAIKAIDFTNESINTISEEIRKHGAIETGGVLLGSVENPTVIVSKIIDAGPKAIHEGTYFRADNNYIEMRIDMEYANSGGQLRYLGEWHTHPQIHPTPSLLDLQSLIEISETSDEFTIMVIVGSIGFTPKQFIHNTVGLIAYKKMRRAFELELALR